MKYGDVTLGQLSRCFQGTLSIGLVNITNLGDFLDGLVKEVIKSGLLQVLPGGEVLESTDLGGGTSVIRAYRHGAEIYSSLAQCPTEARQIWNDLIETFSSDPVVWSPRLKAKAES
jgi:hypothetical protein